MEHRCGQRVEVDLGVHLLARPSGIGPGTLRNISLSGAFVVTTLTLPLLTRVRVICKAGAIDVAALRKMEGYVVRLADDGVGIEWCALLPPSLPLWVSRVSKEFSHE
jgi:hypothetical protein